MWSACMGASGGHRPHSLGVVTPGRWWLALCKAAVERLVSTDSAVLVLRARSTDGRPRVLAHVLAVEERSSLSVLDGSCVSGGAV